MNFEIDLNHGQLMDIISSALKSKGVMVISIKKEGESIQIVKERDVITLYVENKRIPLPENMPIIIFTPGNRLDTH